MYHVYTLADSFPEAKHTEFISGSLKKSYKHSIVRVTGDVKCEKL